MDEMWLNHFEIIRSTHPDHIRDVIRGFMVDHQFIPLGRDAQVDTVVRARTLSDIGLYYIDYGGDVSIKLDGPTGTYFAVQIPTSGKAGIECNSDTFISTNRCASVISPFDDLKMRWSHDCGQLICQVGKAALESHLAGLLDTGRRRPLRFNPSMDVSKGSGLRVRRMIEELVRRIDRGDTVLDDPGYVRQIEQAIMTELLYSQWHNYTDALSVELRAATSKELRYAIDLLQSHPERAHTIHDLARRVNVSVRTLQRGFQRLGTTFQDLLQDVRLGRVHDELRAADPDMVTVIDVMIRWRTPPTGHYFTRYRQLFGESPEETLKRPY